MEVAGCINGKERRKEACFIWSGEKAKIERREQQKREIRFDTAKKWWEGWSTLRVVVLYYCYQKSQ